MKVSDFFTSFFSIQSSASKPFTSPAMRQAYALASNFVIGPMPERPSTSPCQVGSLPTPSGEIMPIPVTTTRRLVMVLSWRKRARERPRTARTAGPCRVGALRSFGALVDVFDRVLDLFDLLGLVVGNLDAELLFESHDQLDRIERVRSEVFDERRFGLDLFGVDTELLDDD